jgi:hypothetical protein
MTSTCYRSMILLSSSTNQPFHAQKEDDLHVPYAEVLEARKRMCRAILIPNITNYEYGSVQSATIHTQKDMIVKNISILHTSDWRRGINQNRKALPPRQRTLPQRRARRPRNGSGLKLNPTLTIQKIRRMMLSLRQSDHVGRRGVRGKPRRRGSMPKTKTTISMTFPILCRQSDQCLADDCLFKLFG